MSNKIDSKRDEVKTQTTELSEKNLEQVIRDGVTRVHQGMRRRFTIWLNRTAASETDSSTSGSISST